MSTVAVATESAGADGPNLLGTELRSAGIVVVVVVWADEKVTQRRSRESRTHLRNMMVVIVVFLWIV